MDRYDKAAVRINSSPLRQGDSEVVRIAAILRESFPESVLNIQDNGDFSMGNPPKGLTPSPQTGPKIEFDEPSDVAVMLDARQDTLHEDMPGRRSVKAIKIDNKLESNTTRLRKALGDMIHYAEQFADNERQALDHPSNSEGGVT